MRRHLHCLIIVPLFVIVMTWPAFPRVFDGDEFWLHTEHNDTWTSYWVTWHLEEVLAGTADLYYTDAMYHPQGTSLAYQHHEMPHSLLFSLMKRALPSDDAYNLLFLLTICFNAFCAYILFQHLFADRWIALFGAVAIGVSAYFPITADVPDVRILGTLPLTLYFYHRAVFEGRWRFAALAGVCAGATTLIGVYTFVFVMISVGLYATCLAPKRWRRPAFWLRLLLLIGLAGVIGMLRFYPFFERADVLRLGTDRFEASARTNDFLEFFVHSLNPVTGDLLHSLFRASPDKVFEDGYLGYINLALLVCALLYTPSRRKLVPWLAMFLFFACMRLGDHLSYNGVIHADTVLPEGVLSDWLPAIFRNIGWPDHYHIGLVYPLAALACFGLAALLRSQPARRRAIVSLAACLIVGIEFYAPQKGKTVEPEQTAYINFIASEPDSAIKVINLPQEWWHRQYYLYTQTLSGWPMAFGFQHRLLPLLEAQINRNLLLKTWYRSQSMHCLPHNERVFSGALDQLLAEGFTHVIVHKWKISDWLVTFNFRQTPAAYDDGYVSVYRLRDLSQSCQPQLDLPQLSRFARSPLALPGPRSSILSVHSRHRIDHENLGYLNSLFGDWHRFVHASAETGAAEIEDLTRESQIIALLVDAEDAEGADVDGLIPSERFQRCRRERHDDGAVIELHIRREFSCALVSSDGGLRIEYENGARLENVIAEASDSHLDLQFFWSDVPDEAHSTSIQIVDAAGEKVASGDAVIEHGSLARQRVDIASLGPGDYQVNLIVYDYHSLRSVAGSIRATGERFQRELTIMTLTRD